MDKAIGKHNLKGYYPNQQGGNGLLNRNGWPNSTIIDISNDFMPSGVNWFSNNNEIQWQNVQSAYAFRSLWFSYPPIAAIIGRKAEAFANGQMELRNSKTGKEIEDKGWEKFMSRPNHAQTWTAFRKQLYSWVYMRGFVYAYVEYAVGFKDIPDAIWLLPPWHILVQPIVGAKPFYQRAEPDKKRQVFFQWQGTQTQLNEEDLVLFTDSTSPIINENTWLPESRLMSCRFPISNGIAIYNADNRMIKNHGALGILSNDKGADQTGSVVPLSSAEMNDARNALDGYGLQPGQQNIILTQAALKWQPMNMNLKDLQHLEKHVQNIKDCCDVLNYPIELLSIGISSKYSNKEEARKGMYQDSILQDSKVFDEQMNSELETKGKPTKVKIVHTFEHVGALQEDEQRSAAGRKARNQALEIEWNNNQITRNTWREQNNLDPLEDGTGEMYKYQFDQWLEQNGYVNNKETDPEADPNENEPDNDPDDTPKAFIINNFKFKS